MKTRKVDSKQDKVDELLKITRKKLGLKQNTKDSRAQKTKIKRSKVKIGTSTKAEPDLEDDMPLALRLQKSGHSEEIIFPHISRRNWKQFEDKLTATKVDDLTQSLNKCIAKMHGNEMYNLHHRSLYFIRLAIVDSLMNRKWNNLLKLVIMLGRNYGDRDPVFTMFFRHLCQILKHYHPDIRGTDVEDEIDLIVEKHTKKRDRQININEVV